MDSFKYLTEEDVNRSLLTKTNNNIKSLLLNNVYGELFDNLSGVQKKSGNDTNPLINAFLQGKIYYIDNIRIAGDFTIKIASEIIKLGGYKYGDYYLLPKSKTPKSLQNRIFIKKTDNLLSKFNNNLIKTLIAVAGLSLFNQEDEEFVKKNYLYKIDKLATKEEVPELNYDTFAKSYLDKYNFNIKGFLNEDLLKLRARLFNKFEEGASINEIKELLKNEYQLNNNRAKRISEGETKIFLNSYQDAKFISMGQDSYKWFHPDPNGESARRGHAMLFKASQEGVVYSILNKPFDPITNKQTSPGEEYGCRCLKIIQIKTYK